MAALRRRAELGGGFAVVGRKGDARAGAVLVKLRNLEDGSVRLLSEAVQGDGSTIWISPTASQDEQDHDAYIERAIRIDPDLWVVEIEDRGGRHFLTEKVEGDKDSPNQG